MFAGVVICIDVAGGVGVVDVGSSVAGCFAVGFDNMCGAVSGVVRYGVAVVDSTLSLVVVVGGCCCRLR